MKSMLMFCLSAALLAGADPNMTAEERTKLVQLLKDSQKEFVQAVSNLSDEQWKWKPTPERWSVGECAEHIVLSEGLLFAKAQEAVKSPADPDWEKKTAGKTEFFFR